MPVAAHGRPAEVAELEDALVDMTASMSDQRSERVGIFKRTTRFVFHACYVCFCLASLLGLLAVLTAIPVLQLIAFGYMLDVAGRLTRGAKLRDALPNLHRAGRIGAICVTIFLASLPTQLLVNWESVAQVISPGSAQAGVLRTVSVFACLFAVVYLMWAWVRGGTLRHYLWPQPIRFLKEGWRWKTWKYVPDRVWDFTVELEIPRLFWLGLRGALGTLVWLIPALIVSRALAVGQTGLAGLIGFVALAGLGFVMLYLPMLQANFAAENRLGAMFEFHRIRDDFRRAPWAWLVAMALGLVILQVPLYLLRIEAIPDEIAWVPSLVFAVFMLPARVVEGLALRRARSKTEIPSGAWPMISRWAVRILMLAVVFIYLVFLFVFSTYINWNGLQSWVLQHAVFVPAPLGV